MKEKSCGTIPYTIDNGIVRYLLIKNKRGGTCGFPKGHVEDGESEIETALRETVEETSVTPTVNDDFRYEMSYKMGNGNYKTVVYFLGEFHGMTPRRNGNFEDFDYLILPYDEARRRLTFDNAKAMLDEANSFLMRHSLATH
jgi:8-oxo-dGTP pyrophosphatase MutT (NUDIX family)